jgi:hypothetical protein
MSNNRLPYLDYMVEVLNACARALRGDISSYLQIIPILSIVIITYFPAGKSLDDRFMPKERGCRDPELREKMIRRTGCSVTGCRKVFGRALMPKVPCLSQVIITRLPFENPGHPVLEG